MKIGVMGAGAVGCYYGVLLAKTGHEVTLIGPARVRCAGAGRGVAPETATSDDIVPVQAATDAAALGEAEVVLFCVKSTATETAGELLASHLKRGAAVLTFQNGVDNAVRLSAVLRRAVIPAGPVCGRGDGRVGSCQAPGSR